MVKIVGVQVGWIVHLVGGVIPAVVGTRSAVLTSCSQGPVLSHRPAANRGPNPAAPPPGPLAVPQLDVTDTTEGLEDAAHGVPVLVRYDYRLQVGGKLCLAIVRSTGWLGSIFRAACAAIAIATTCCGLDCSGLVPPYCS